MIIYVRSIATGSRGQRDLGLHASMPPCLHAPCKVFVPQCPMHFWSDLWQTYIPIWHPGMVSSEAFHAVLCHDAWTAFSLGEVARLALHQPLHHSQVVSHCGIRREKLEICAQIHVYTLLTVLPSSIIYIYKLPVSMTMITTSQNFSSALF